MSLRHVYFPFKRNRNAKHVTGHGQVATCRQNKSRIAVFFPFLRYSLLSFPRSAWERTVGTLRVPCTPYSPSRDVPRGARRRRASRAVCSHAERGNKANLPHTVCAD